VESGARAALRVGKAAERKVGLNDDRASHQYLNSSARVA